METRTSVPATTDARHHVDSLDGIRAIAILMVLAFHFRMTGLPFREAGYLGVDVFFVLSGFLITSLLFAERRRTNRVSMRGFYFRRAVRLVPVAAVLLAIGAVVFVFAPTTYSWRPQPIAFPAVVFSWMNWLDVWRPTAGGVLAHTWSLSIEAQFYFVWPPLLVFALARRVRLRYVLVVLGGLVALAVGLRVRAWAAAPPAVPKSAPDVTRYLVGSARGHAWSRWYFGSFSHMDGLIVGAMAAIVLTRTTIRAFVARHRVAAQVALGVATLVGAALYVKASWVGVGGFIPVWGLLPFEVCVAVIVVVLAAVPRTVAGSLLGCAPMVWIGRRSYAMYMLHIPVWIVVVRLEGDVSLTVVSWIALVGTFVVAELSFRFVETPALRWRRRRAAPG
jgi:peptidoglycan/LPS O-acetylase OafA/YrhL